MADMKKASEDVLRETAHALAEIAAKASAAISDHTREALAGIGEVARASAALPANTGELLAQASCALVKEFELGLGQGRTEFRGVRLMFNCNDFEMGFEELAMRRPLPEGQYRAVLFILPVKP